MPNTLLDFGITDFRITFEILKGYKFCDNKMKMTDGNIKHFPNIRMIVKITWKFFLIFQFLFK